MIDPHEWEAKLKAAYVLGFDAGMKARKSKPIKEWVSRMVRLSVHALTGGFWSPLDAYEFNEKFDEAFRPAAVPPAR